MFNKRFQSNENGEVVTVTNDTGVFYSLSNGANIKKDIFFQKFSEMLDASSFFQSQSAAGLSSLTEKIRTIDENKVQNISGNIPPGVKYLQEPISEQVQAPPEYKEMLLRRFNEEQAHKDLSQYKVYENEDDAAADFERRQKAVQQRERQIVSLRHQQEQAEITESQVSSMPTEHPVSSSIPSSAPMYMDAEEEAFRFFKSFKKVYPITLSVDFDERIAEPNFIKMMAVNYEGDIIKYYTREFMNRIQNDPGFLENKIYEKLRSIVFQEEKEKKPRKPKAAPVVEKKVTPKKRVTIPSVPKKDNHI
jgi:hypothetical protein